MSKETFFFMPKTSAGIKAKKVFKFSQRLFFRENSFTGFHLERKTERGLAHRCLRKFPKSFELKIRSEALNLVKLQA